MVWCVSHFLQAAAGATSLWLRDDPVAMGWRTGDRVGIATTKGVSMAGVSTTHTVTAIFGAG